MFKSFDYIEIYEIKVFVNITQSTFNFGNVTRIIWRSLATNPIDGSRPQASSSIV